MMIFITYHLHRIYCAQSHLVERLNDIVDNVDFAPFKREIADTIVSTEKETVNLQEVYALLNTSYSLAGLDDMVQVLESAFHEVQLKKF